MFEYFINVCFRCWSDALIGVFCVSQVEESVAEEKVHSEERIPHHLTRHSKPRNKRQDHECLPWLKQMHTYVSGPPHTHTLHSASVQTHTHIRVSVSWLQAASPAGHYLHPLTMNILTDSSREHKLAFLSHRSLPRLSLFNFELCLFPYEDLTGPVNSSHQNCSSHT